MSKKLTTEEFIKQAKEVHGDLYDYSKVNYVNSLTKITIMCHEHGEFEQRPNSHLNSNGCRKCSNTKNGNTQKLTTNEFIRKAKDVHGDKYDYSKVAYINNSTNVILYCMKHNFEFEQSPANHLKGKGCPMCGGSKKLTTNEFIRKAKDVHGDKYDYSKVVYVNTHTPVIIIDEYGFEHKQTPSGHLGCKKLTNLSVINKTEYFIFKAKEIHGNKYDYSKVNYTNTENKVTIICPIHGNFEQIPHSHLNSNGCPICACNRKSTTEEFIEKAKEVHEDKYDYSKVRYVDTKTSVIIVDEYGFEHLQLPSVHLGGGNLTFLSVINKTEYFKFKAKEVHGDNYDYSMVDYVDSHTPIIIICPKHGKFKQTPTCHLSGGGCVVCSGKKLTTEEFIEKSKEVHGNKYNYSMVDYIGTHIPVVIVDEYGFEHLQIPSSHLSGRSLTIQSAINKIEYFIFKAKQIHGDKYDYSKVDYNGANTKVIIKCLIHGEFEQQPANHLNGAGCPICGLGFTKSYKLDLINTLENSDLLIMDAIELLLIINQGKLPQEFDALITSESYSDERIATINELREHFSNEDEESINAEEITLEIEENNDFTTVDDVDNEIIIESPSVGSEEDDKPSLPVVRIVDDLRMLDNEIYATMDEEAFSTLVEYKLRKLWNNVLNNNITYEDILKEEGSKYFTLIKNSFIEEYNDVINYKPKGCYSFPFKPNLMQKLTVHRLLKNKNYGNWSGTGAGKTLSFILASREIESKLTLIIAVNATIEQTKNSILEVYPDSKVYTEYENDMVFDRNNYNYLVMNYEKFQQEYSEELCQSLTNNNQIDLIVVDEVHSVKQRTEQIESLRHEVINKMFGRIRENNPNCFTLLMSATPVINELYEAKSLLKLMTGLDYDDINTRRTIKNALNIFIQLTTNGIRFIPKYQLEIDELTGHNMTNLNIDGTHLIDELLEIPKGSFTQAELLLLDDKLNAVKSYLKKGTVVYTYYTTDIVDRIKKFVKQQGFSCETYTGEESPEFRKNSLNRFINGQTDILIGSKPIGTGVDGLQKVCDRMIIITLPWTDSEYTQLKGRIYRQGSKFNNVEIIIPQVKIKLEDNSYWSWDIQRLNLIKNKKTLADCAVDGLIPSRVLPSPETMYNKSIESLSNWKERISQGNIIENDRKKTIIDLYPDVINEDEIKTRIESEINEVHRKANTSYSSTTHKEFTNNPESFFRYHQLRNQRMEKWEEIPYEYIATKIKNKNHIVADFGCGENKFKDCIPHNKVYSFDHVAFDDTVVACDMKNTQLENESIDDAVFSLSLWGINYEDYIKEAYRILNYGGTIYISEPSNKYTTEEKDNLKSLLIKNNFKIIGDVEIRGKFFYLRGFKE